MSVCGSGRAGQCGPDLSSYLRPVTVGQRPDGVQRATAIVRGRGRTHARSGFRGAQDPTAARATGFAQSAPVRRRRAVPTLGVARRGNPGDGAGLALQRAGSRRAPLLLYLTLLRRLRRRPPHRRSPGRVLAVGFFLAELKVVDVHFRRETHSFSLSEFPAVVGLFLLSPDDYLLAVLVGSGVRPRLLRASRR